MVVLAVTGVLLVSLDADAAYSKPVKSAKTQAAPSDPSMCSDKESNVRGPAGKIKMKQLHIPGYSDDQHDGDVKDSHQNDVMISVLTQAEAKQLAAQLRRHHSEMGGKLNSWGTNRVCDSRAYLMDCYAQTDCNVVFGRVFLKKPFNSIGTSMTIRGEDYTSGINFHTASLVYVLDDNGVPKLNVIDPYANNAGDDNWTGAYTPVPYLTWATQKVKANNWDTRFVPRFTSYGQFENTSAEANINDKCSVSAMESAKGIMYQAVREYRNMSRGTVQ